MGEGGIEGAGEEEEEKMAKIKDPKIQYDASRHIISLSFIRQQLALEDGC